MEFPEINFSFLWQAALNGGKPVSDWDEVKHWAEKLLRVKDADNA